MHLIFLGLLAGAVALVGVYAGDDVKVLGQPVHVDSYQEYPTNSFTPAEGGANNIRSMR